MPVPKAEVLELMRLDVDPAEVNEIRELWKAHSKAEDARSIEGLMATLTPDCTYTVYPDDVSWHGHEGATRFYTELLTAFPDIVFELQNIVIGPQGVVEEAIVTGTHERPLARPGADRRAPDLAQRDLLPLGPRGSPLHRRAGLHRHAEEASLMAHAFSSLDELGDGHGFRKIRGPLGDHGVRGQRARLPARLRGLPPLPRHAGRALLRPQRHRPLRGGRRGRGSLGPGGLVHVESTDAADGSRTRATTISSS